MKARVPGGTLLSVIVIAIFAGTIPAIAQEQSTGEPAGAPVSQILIEGTDRPVETPPAAICGGCVSPTFTTQGKGSILQQQIG